MPATRNLSFVIIQHLSPDYKSLLVELVSKHTEMQVLEAGHNMELQKNCVYVIPNNKLLTIEGGKLQLSEKNFEKAPNTAIDTFFKSLAKDQGNKAIAVILSGTGTDGTRGSEALHNNGGLVLVQDPISAKFDGMPNSAIAAGYADYILTPELMPEEIFNYTNEHPVTKSVKGRPDENSLPEVLQLIEQHCGHDFHNYKTPTILRRITRRMGSLGKKDFADYLELLRKNPDECKILGKEFLIGVTKFFRDEAAFEVLNQEILPRIIEAKEDHDVLKVWITACSTGQEAYSMAILLDDYLKKAGKLLEVKIFATDIDADAIEQASKGTFSSAALEEMKPEWLHRYFIQQNDNYTIIPQIRKQIVFARHNILKDPPFIKNDLVTCRNMLIYMNAVLQRKVLSTLLFSLHKGGYLWLGPSEIPSSIKTNLEELNGKWKIFKKLSDANPYQGDRLGSGYSIRNQREVKPYKPVRSSNRAASLAEEFQQILTEQFGFAAIYIDELYEVKEAVGDFRRYLSLPEKIINLNVLKMVSTDLSVALNTAIRKAKKAAQDVSLQHIKVKEGNTERYIDLLVKPAGKEGLTTVVFAESKEAALAKTVIDFVSHPNPAEGDAYITELEEELKETRSHLQMAIESLETTNEELQSSNEELLSANEELQSSNEELQSLNEELHTLNTEHQLRIKELVELNDDLNNYFRSSQIGQVFVDEQLRIRKFNTAAVQMINLIESDIGRPIEHISTNIRNEDVLEIIYHVINQQKVMEREITLVNGTICLMRILPFVRQDKKVDGVVITFIDITANKQLDNIIKGVFNSSISAIMALQCVRDRDGYIEDFNCIAGNYALENFLHQKSTDYVGKSFKNDFSVLQKNGFFEKCQHVVNTGTPLHIEMLFDQHGRQEWFEVVANKMMDGIVITLTNIDEKKLAQEKLKKNYHELIKAKENLKALNAGLEEMVRERTVELSKSEERFRLIANATSDAIWDWNLVNNEVWWSDSFYHLFGFTAADTFIQNNSFRIQNIHPDDRQEVQRIIYDAINNASQQWTVSYRFKKADGTYAIILDKGSVVQDEFGTPYRVLGSMMDITDAEATAQQLKQKNHELHQLIEEFTFVTDFMPQMVWATQPDGYHDFFNKRWYDFTGMNYEQTKDKGWSQLLHPDDYERSWQVWKESLVTGKHYETEYRMRRSDGEYRWLLARALPLRDEQGNILKWFGTCTDIHDQKIMSDVLEQKVKERTRELQKINQELEASNNELLQFASVASHDLKEPLRKIHMFSNLVKERYLQHSDNGAVDYINRIINSSARMTRLINDLLTFSRLSINSFFEPTDVNDVVSEVLGDLELLVKEKQATVEVDRFPKMEIVPGQMRQVFQNLISNSLKFSRTDVLPYIQINCELVDSCAWNAAPSATGAFCRITIKDNGIGFDEQYVSKIFTIFQRLHSREKYEGTGIGLAITKKIIEKHNGLIHALSRDGEGAAFIVVLPITQNPIESPASSGLADADHFN